MDVLAIRGAIATVLAPLLGTYTLSNGATTPAIVVRDPGEGMTAGTTVSGLEVVISSVPELEEQAQYRLAPFIQTWNVFLLDWGGTNIEDAMATLQSGFPGATAVLLAVLEDQGPKRQAQIRLPVSRESNQLPVDVQPTRLLIPRSISINLPQGQDSFTIFRAVQETTLASISALTSNGSVTCQVFYGLDRSASGVPITASTTVTNRTTGQLLTLTNQPIPANAYVWVNITSVNTLVQEFHISIGF